MCGVHRPGTEYHSLPAGFAIVGMIRPSTAKDSVRLAYKLVRTLKMDLFFLLKTFEEHISLMLTVCLFFHFSICKM